ncbi:MAG TPA: hypothetical protein VK619_12350 [Pyrinomonadaceae bacterium]|nr:hypothetical protein [Pyrinomonadaceae bacterium]
MDWMNQLGGLLQQYSGAATGQAPATAHDDFDQVAQHAPQSALADGLAAAFRSDQTPPFENMVGQLFTNGSGEQRAGLLNTVIAAAGPAIVSQMLSRGGSGASGLAGLLAGGQTEVTPEQAQQVSPEAAEHLAAEAARHNPSVIDEVSNFYSQHPTLVKTLGAAALAIAISKIAGRS